MLLGVVAVPHAAGARDTAEAVYHGYRADLLETVPPGELPSAILALPPRGPSAWPAAVRQEIEERIRLEWSGQRAYGAR